jgi:Fe-Mn family superoxide dismutase
MAFILPELPFNPKAFGTFITEEGFQYHHGKHHAAYVNNLNKNTEGTKFAGLGLEEIIIGSAKESLPAVFNNAAQHFNHSFFWNSISPNGGGAPSGKISELLNQNFGSFDEFKTKFSNAATTLFGSGWAWLVMNEAGKLEIVQTSNAGTPLVDNKKPLLTLDVWEHAYYIDHRNARPKYIESFWDFVNWINVNNMLK